MFLLCFEEFEDVWEPKALTRDEEAGVRTGEGVQSHSLEVSIGHISHIGDRKLHLW
jgi:hypothetical protein